MKLRKKQDGGLKKLLIIFLFLIISSKHSFSEQILDFETEEFITEILEDIKKVNKIKKNINFKINSNNKINAFVDYNNVIHINSGLIHYSQDYVALLSVLAHEVGHVDLNHISSRKKKIENINKYRNLSFLSVIAGSAITRSPEILQSSIISNAAISNQYIDFTKDQEIEADLYALRTLKLLNTNSNSVINLLQTIEQKLIEKGFSKKKQRVSTHPYFKDRLDLINSYNNSNQIKSNSIDFNYNNRFNFIRAKFLGYNNYDKIIESLHEPYKTYAKSIKYSRDGNLKMSLENINELIKNKSKNDFILETKADILFSHGYTKEALKFYKSNLKNYPLNFYAQIRIFENIEIKHLSQGDIEIVFQNNKDLLYKFYNNKNVLLKYFELAQKLNKKEWLQLFDFFLSINEMGKEVFDIEIKNFKNTKDRDLLKLINIVENIN